MIYRKFEFQNASPPTIMILFQANVLQQLQCFHVTVFTDLTCQNIRFVKFKISTVTMGNKIMQLSLKGVDDKA